MRRNRSSITFNRKDRNKGERNFTGKAVCFIVLLAMTGILLTGCSAITTDKGYTRKELDNLAKLEVYEAGSDKLLRTIEDEEILYQYNQTAVDSVSVFEADWEEEETELKEAPDNAAASYYIVSYKYPTAKFGDKELKKNTTITLYQDTNIAKIAVDPGAVKSIALPEEFLTFYYQMSEEESAFYESLLEEG